MAKQLEKVIPNQLATTTLWTLRASRVSLERYFGIPCFPSSRQVSLLEVSEAVLVNNQQLGFS